MPVTIGRYNTLRATASHAAGMALDGGVELGDILLPKRYVPADLEIGDEIEVFISLDSEDRLVATTEKPLVQAGEFASLEVIACERVGAFLDWGMPKDLLLPFSEQRRRVRVGERELVHVYLDEVSGRLVASARLNRFLAEVAPAHVKQGEAVELIIADKTDIGYRAIVDGRYWGLLYADAVFEDLERGARMSGYIRTLREDSKVDLALGASGYARVDANARKILSTLADEGGFLPLHDKSHPEKIRMALGMSKKVFKQALGGLYKKRLVQIEAEGVRLVSSESEGEAVDGVPVDGDVGAG